MSKEVTIAEKIVLSDPNTVQPADKIYAAYRRDRKKLTADVLEDVYAVMKETIGEAEREELEAAITGALLDKVLPPYVYYARDHPNGV